MKELVIIGAGPAGISLAAEAIGNGLKPSEILIIEKANEHSFSIRKYYPDSKPVTANYKGLDSQCEGILCLQDTTKEGTLNLLSQTIESNKLNVNYKESVYKIEPTKQGYFLIDTDKDRYISKSCVIAIGVMGRPNRPNYPIPNDCLSFVHYDVTSKQVKNSRCLVVGGGDSASEYAQYLTNLGNDVTLAYRKEKFSRMNTMNKKLLIDLETLGKVKVLRKTDIKSVAKDNKRVIVNYNTDISDSFDHIYYALGGTSPKTFLNSIGIEFTGGIPTLTGNCETTVPGLFLVGDLSAGAKGGSIISAFNSSHRAIQTICRDYLHCGL